MCKGWKAPRNLGRTSNIDIHLSNLTGLTCGVLTLLCSPLCPQCQYHDYEYLRVHSLALHWGIGTSHCKKVLGWAAHCLLLWTRPEFTLSFWFSDKYWLRCRNHVEPCHRPSGGWLMSHYKPKENHLTRQPYAYKGKSNISAAIQYRCIPLAVNDIISTT